MFSSLFEDSAKGLMAFLSQRTKTPRGLCSYGANSRARADGLFIFSYSGRP